MMLDDNERKRLQPLAEAVLDAIEMLKGVNAMSTMTPRQRWPFVDRYLEMAKQLERLLTLSGLKS